MTKVRITIDITYNGDEPDHSTLLDTFQDLPIMEDMLSPDGQEVVEHVVSVETPAEVKPGTQSLHGRLVDRLQKANQ
jgi:hypothetical protein